MPESGTRGRGRGNGGRSGCADGSRGGRGGSQGYYQRQPPPINLQGQQQQQPPPLPQQGQPQPTQQARHIHIGDLEHIEDIDFIHEEVD
eukprot:14794613-Ditylum_brightwellii.AAC.1